MHTVTISSKNQITLPKALLRSLSLDSQDKLRLQIDKKCLVATPVARGRLTDLAGSLTCHANSSRLGKSWSTVMKEANKLKLDQYVKKCE